jgi:hypothetical protein
MADLWEIDHPKQFFGPQSQYLTNLKLQIKFSENDHVEIEGGSATLKLLGRQEDVPLTVCKKLSRNAPIKTLDFKSEKIPLLPSEFLADNKLYEVFTKSWNNLLLPDLSHSEFPTEVHLSFSSQFDKRSTLTFVIKLEEPGESVVPTESTEPTVSTESTEPTIPTKSTESTETTETTSTASTVSMVSTEPTVSMVSTDPTIPTEPTESTETTETTVSTASTVSMVSTDSMPNDPPSKIYVFFNTEFTVYKKQCVFFFLVRKKFDYFGLLWEIREGRREEREEGGGRKRRRRRRTGLHRGA